MKNFKLFTLTIIAAVFIVACAGDDDAPQNTNTGTPNSIAFPDATICENGFAGVYPCNGYDLMAHVPLTVFGAVRGNDSWGWTDPQTGKRICTCRN